MTEQLREWLAEKEARGVTQVRVVTVLARLDEEQERSLEALLNSMSRRRRFEVMRRLLYDLHPEFVGTKEAAELLGVERPRIGRYLRKKVMPQPIGIVSKSIPFWLRADVEPLKALVEGRRRDHDGDKAAAA